MSSAADRIHLRAGRALGGIFAAHSLLRDFCLFERDTPFCEVRSQTNGWPWIREAMPRERLLTLIHTLVSPETPKNDAIVWVEVIS